MNAQGPGNTGGPHPPNRHRAALRANPLRRTSDRLESWVSGILLSVLLLGLPAASVAAGWSAYTSGMRTVQSQNAERHRVEARLTADAQGTGQRSDEENVQQAPVRWTEKDGTQHSGTARVIPGADKGETVKIWVDREGTVTEAPMPSGSAVATGWLAGGLTAGAVTAGVLGTRRSARYVLDRRRYAQWDAEWELLEPLWSKRLPG